MKTKFVICAALFVVFAVSCKKDDKGLLDPNAMISLRAEKASRASDNPNHLTPRQIVEQAGILVFTNEKNYPGVEEISRGFDDRQRDFANERLLMFGTDIITDRGLWEPGFIEGENFVLVRFVERISDTGAPYYVYDTIAYLKNSVVRAAYLQIRKAFDEKDYPTCYKLFDEAFSFTPITGAEWRELHDKGMN